MLIIAINNLDNTHGQNEIVKSSICDNALLLYATVEFSRSRCSGSWFHSYSFTFTTSKSDVN